MLCPWCGHDLGDGILPARCPACAHNLANPTDAPGGAEGARRAAASRAEVAGVAEVRRSSPVAHRTRRLAVAGMAAAAFVVLAALLGWWLELWGGHAATDVVGWQLERACRELEAEGFSVETTEELADGPEGLVTSMDPAPGARLAEGSVVRLGVSRARRMPDVVGMGAEEAEEALAAQGLPCTVEERPDDGEEGVVLEASPEAGRQANSTDEVVLVVSVPRTVPDVVGKTRDEAALMLEEADLALEVSYVDTPEGQEDGTVSACEPGVGERMAAGQAVTLKVNRDRSRRLEERAREVLGVVYGTDPLAGDYAIGAGLRGLLAPTVVVSGSTTVADATNYEVYYGVVKHWRSMPEEVGQTIATLPRTLVSVDELTLADDDTVEASVTVSWDWSRMGAGYEGVVSSDRHQVTMTFDEEGRLLTFDDPQTDVPSYRMSK